MIELVSLADLGAWFRKIDQSLINVLATRMRLALQVEERKRKDLLTKQQGGTAEPGEQEIFIRPDIEEKRLVEISEYGTRYKIAPEFSRALLYMVIGESCRMQILQSQGAHAEDPAPEDLEEYYRRLKKNLLMLTSQIAATYDERYDAKFYATRAYLEYESGLIHGEIGSMDDVSLAMDLGCATGRKTLSLARTFDAVVGFDISPEMIKQGEHKLTATPPRGKVTFEVADIENGILRPDGSASLVVMNLGTAGDVRDIRGVIKEVHRVLKPGGRTFLSFYNKEALIYSIDFIPWPLGLAAEINPRKDCLTVHLESGESYSIYARAYTLGEVRGLFDTGFKVTHVSTYPAISSLLPNDFLEEETVRAATKDIDATLAGGNLGAYITVVAQKR